MISIISILAAMMAPGLTRARMHAIGISCLSNQRQIGIYLTVYTLSYNDYLPPPKWSGETWARLTKVYNEPTSYAGARWTYTSSPAKAQEAYTSYAMYRCPAVLPGGADDPAAASHEVYGMNGWLAGKWQDWRTFAADDKTWVKLSQVGRRPLNTSTGAWISQHQISRTILLADTHSKEPSVPGAGAQYFFFDFSACAPVLRHLQACNTLMGDGSAKAQHLGNLEKMGQPGRKVWAAELVPLSF